MANKIVDLGNVLGPPGPSGKSAYSAAVDGGYKGTEAEFNAEMAAVGDNANLLTTINTNTADTKAKIGATGDTGGTATAGSIFAKLNKLLTDWTAARAAKIDTIDTNSANASTKSAAAATDAAAAKTNTAVNNTPSATGTLSQKLSQIIADIAGISTAVNNKGAVKSVQRGVMAFADMADDSHVITISAVNPAKCVVMFDNRVLGGSNALALGAEFISLTATQLTVKRPMYNGSPKTSAMWQIVEFY